MVGSKSITTPTLTLKVAHIIDSVSRNAGGVFYSVDQLTAELSSLPDLQLAIHGIDDPNCEKDRLAWEGRELTIHPSQGPRSLGYSSELGRALLSEDCDLMHVHAIWQFQSQMTHAAFRKRRTPYVISPHGMLDSWALAQSRWKKRIASCLYEAAHLRDAGCLHALCEPEAQAIRSYGLTNPVCIIPNGVILPEFTEPLMSRNERKTLLFLGRLHPKKGLLNALRAWTKLQPSMSNEWQFVIAGWDQNGHEAELKHLLDELNLTYDEVTASEFVKLAPDSSPPSSVIFVGPAFDATKDTLLTNASAFILPSFSEGLPMSILEAWSYRLPVLMTDHCNLPEGFAADAAIGIGTDVESIANGMQLLMSFRTSSLRALGNNGRELVKKQFTWQQVATQMMQVYQWVLGENEKPDCVTAQLT